MMPMLSRAALVLALCSLIFLLGFPLYMDCAAFLLAAVAGAFVARSKLLLLFGSLLLSILAAEVGGRILSKRTAGAAHYRPEEKYSGESRYEAGVDAAFPMPHGDLLAIDPHLPRSLAQPRTVRFATDSTGYRNDANYASEPLVIVGDSLIAGTGNDQDDLLVNVLRRELGIESYSLAFPTDPSGYFRMVEEFLRQERSPFKVIVFVFEGNDFHGPGRGLAKPGRYDALKLRATRYLNSVVLTASFHASRRLERLLWPRLDSETEVYQVGARPMAFYGSYIDKAVADSLRFEPGAPSLEVLGRVEGVFFIPTKYRVYFSLLDDRRGRRLPSPPPGSVALRVYFEKHGIPVVDLTGPLVEAATEALQTDEYVFWRDDTHWNGRGVRVAAKELASFLERNHRRIDTVGVGADSEVKTRMPHRAYHRHHARIQGGANRRENLPGNPRRLLR